MKSGNSITMFETDHATDQSATNAKAKIMTVLNSSIAKKRLLCSKNYWQIVNVVIVWQNSHKSRLILFCAKMCTSSDVYISSKTVEEQSQ